jgi:hypothetical protein
MIEQDRRRLEFGVRFAMIAIAEDYERVAQHPMTSESEAYAFSCQARREASQRAAEIRAQYSNFQFHKMRVH